MRNESPLDEWLIFDSAGFQPSTAIAVQRNAEVRAGLNQLEDYLDNPPPPKRFNLMNIRLPGRWNGALAKEYLPCAQMLYQRVLETGGTGSLYIQEALLYLICPVGWLHCAVGDLPTRAAILIHQRKPTHIED